MADEARKSTEQSDEHYRRLGDRARRIREAYEAKLARDPLTPIQRAELLAGWKPKRNAT